MTLADGVIAAVACLFAGCDSAVVSVSVNIYCGICAWSGNRPTYIFEKSDSGCKVPTNTITSVSYFLFMPICQTNTDFSDFKSYQKIYLWHAFLLSFIDVKGAKIKLERNFSLNFRGTDCATVTNQISLFSSWIIKNPSRPRPNQLSYLLNSFGHDASLNPWSMKKLNVWS